MTTTVETPPAITERRQPEAQPKKGRRMVEKAVIPREADGSIDWGQYVRLAITILVVMVPAIMYFQRIASAVETNTTLIKANARAIAEHENIGWHGRMGERVSALERDIAHNEKAIGELKVNITQNAQMLAELRSIRILLEKDATTNIRP